MLNAFFMGAALTIGQGSPIAPPAPTGDSSFASERAAQISMPQPTLPMPLPAMSTLPKATQLPSAQTVPPGNRTMLSPTSNPSGLPVLMHPVQSPMPMPTSSAPMATLSPMPSAEPKKNGSVLEAMPETKSDDKGYLMAALEGTGFGSVFESERIKVYGWGAFSYTESTRNVSNAPMGWNDRADSALMQQLWVNIEKPTDWTDMQMQHGFKVALLYGSDYRFTLIRGFFNNQLKNQNLDPNERNGFEQNLYGGDIPEFYYSLFLPGIGGEGTEIVIGRMFCQFGYESNAAALTPLMSRSYTFMSTPFFHTGVMATTNVNSNLTVKNMIVNGNNVFFDGSQDWRYSGVLQLSTDDESQKLSLGTSFGQGKFNASKPNGPAQGITTIGLAYEPFGRNNGNYFDLVYTNKLTDDWSIALEAMYGYQRDVPAAATSSPTTFGGGKGTANWESVVGYCMYNFNDKWTGITRFEVFHDAQGTQTGFDGTYWVGTVGLQYKPCKDITIRPEARYDYNPDSTPFRGHHGLFTVGADLIIRF
jgi:hypothetical protein